MPIAISTTETIPRRSGDDYSINSASTPTRTRMVETIDGYDFPDLNDKEPQQQIEILVHALEVENRIKDGAENLLELNRNDLQENLRKRVQTELLAARKKIEAITKKLEEVRALTRGLRKKPVNFGGSGSSGSSTRWKGFPTLTSKKSREDLTDKDNFRTAMTLATSQVAQLVVHARNDSGPGSSSGSGHFSDEDINKSRIDAMNTLVSALKGNARVRYEIDTNELMKAILPALSDRASKECRAAAYRLLRYTLVAENFHEFELDWYIVRTLVRDSKHHVEKEQAILLIRALVNGGSNLDRRPATAGGRVPVSEPIMRAMIAIAEQPEEPFRGICLVTLTEILLVDTELVYRTGGIRVLIQAISDGPPELGPLFASAFLFIIDSPKTRIYLQPDVDLENALAGITDAYGKGEDHVETMKQCCKIIQVLLRSWSGLMYLCMNEMRAIRATVDTLRIPSLQRRDVILDMFFDLLNIKTPDWYNTFISGRRLTLYVGGKPNPLHSNIQEPPPKPPERIGLTDQYIGLLLLVLVKAGLVDALTGILQEPEVDPGLSRKATLLLGEILDIANRVLPSSTAAQIQSLPGLFSLAADYSSGTHRITGTTAFSSLDSFNRNKSRLEFATHKDGRPRANSVEESVRRGQRQVEQNKINLGMQIDDKAFQNLLIETQVTLTKDETKWNFNILVELLEGPLLSQKRQEEAFKVHKWGRRLMAFFHPFSHRFSDLPNTKANRRWVRFGCTLLTTLIKHPEGRKSLSDDPFLGQIVDCFAQLDPSNGKPSSDPIFSRKRIESTLTYAYLEMLGVLSKYPEGVELMERFRVFTALYHLSELRGRDDLIKGIIQNIDYSTDGHARVVLAKALTSRYTDIRVYATEFLGQLIQASPKASHWAMRFLLTQLYDPSADVRELVVHILEDACESPEILELAVQMQPNLDHLGDIGESLLLKFMSTNVGFQYLYDSDYIESEMDAWFHERNSHYVVQIEVYLAKAFSPNGLDDDDLLAFEGTVPPHFYGAMAKTELGCQVLTERGHLAEFAHFIRQHGFESEDLDLISKLKSVLWAVGNIGATERGLPFLEEEELIPTITEIARESPVLSVRGTCFFVLGLLSSTVLGAELLDDYGWGVKTTNLGISIGVAIPSSVEEFVAIPAWTTPTMRGAENNLHPPTDPLELDVLTAIYNLGNNVIANAASRTLVRLKGRPESKHVFSSVPLFYRALHTISSQRYRLAVRRYILELFDITLNAETVRELREYGNTILSQPMSNRREKGERPLTMIRTVEKYEDGEAELDIDDGHDSEMNQPPKDHELMSIKTTPLHKLVGFDA
ncbi:hypothetical protein M422DRAFT_24511 [Sphaerobolus stellatus SS14]|nr:hypothetical protein M422DRAFT_24511 [Sphaerobolus stellatus SS14]